MAENLYRHLISRYGVPGEVIVFDQGSEFDNNLVDELFDILGAKVNVIPANQPAKNGQAES